MTNDEIINDLDGMITNIIGIANECSEDLYKLSKAYDDVSEFLRNAERNIDKFEEVRKCIIENFNENKKKLIEEIDNSLNEINEYFENNEEANDIERTVLKEVIFITLSDFSILFKEIIDMFSEDLDDIDRIVLNDFSNLLAQLNEFRFKKLYKYNTRVSYDKRYYYKKYKKNNLEQKKKVNDIIEGFYKVGLGPTEILKELNKMKIKISLSSVKRRFKNLKIEGEESENNGIYKRCN